MSLLSLILSWPFIGIYHGKWFSTYYFPPSNPSPWSSVVWLPKPPLDPNSVLPNSETLIHCSWTLKSTYHCRLHPSPWNAALPCFMTLLSWPSFPASWIAPGIWFPLSSYRPWILPFIQGSVFLFLFYFLEEFTHSHPWLLVSCVSLRHFIEPLCTLHFSSANWRYYLMWKSNELALWKHLRQSLSHS